MVFCTNNSSVTITWMGHSMFLMDFFQGLKVVTDPYSLKTGYKPPYTEPDIVTVSHYHHDHGNIQAIGGSPAIIDKLGTNNFPVNELSVAGIISHHDEVGGAKRGENIIFKFSFRDLSLVHMGDYGQPLNDKHTGFLRDIDVMLIPIGGTFTIGPTQAADIVTHLKPRIVIPMHYRTKHYNREDVETYKPFADRMQYVRKIGSSAIIEKASLPKETEVWVMEYIQKK